HEPLTVPGNCAQIVPFASSLGRNYNPSPVTMATPAYGPESYGSAEAFIGSFDAPGGRGGLRRAPRPPGLSTGVAEIRGQVRCYAGRRLGVNGAGRQPSDGALLSCATPKSSLGPRSVGSLRATPRPKGVIWRFCAILQRRLTLSARRPQT